MSLYLDTSCLLKLVLIEPESARVSALANVEPVVIISTLAELEAEQQLWAQVLGGFITKRDHRLFLKGLRYLRGSPPFLHKSVPHDIAQLSRDQIARSPTYCRTPDRLHLAAMEALGADRLLTNDDQQATAARALGFEVLLPR